MRYDKKGIKPSLSSIGSVGTIGSGLLSEASKNEKKNFISKTENIKLDYIFDNEKNAYSQTDIESLAESIRMIGLHENLVAIRVNDEHYVLTSGHRRLKALKMLRKDGYWGDYAPVSIKELSDIQLDIDDEKKELLMIIATNKERRNNSEMDVLLEVEQYTEIINELRSKGYKSIYGQQIEGVKTRDLVAENFGMSSQTARRHMTVAKNATDAVKNAIALGDLSVNTASEIVTESPEIQDKIIKKVLETKEKDGEVITATTFKKAKEEVKRQIYMHGGINQWENDTMLIRDTLEAKGEIALSETDYKNYNRAINILSKIFIKKC